MNTWADWLACAAVIVALSTFVIAIIGAWLAARFTSQTFLKLGRHEISKLREGWKERLRWNLAGLLELVEEFKAASDEARRIRLRVKIVRRAARTRLMLTPGKHEKIEQEIEALLSSVGIDCKSPLIEVSRPTLKDTWEQIEDEYLDRKRKD